MDVKTLATELAALRQAISQAVVGYDHVVDNLLIALLARGHVLLEGVPGLAKTTLAKTFASSSGLHFRRLQFTQDLLPADITGHFFYSQSRGEFELRPGPVFTNLLLADEINRAPPKVHSALLEAMEEHQATIEGVTKPLPSPFMVVATMNPIDFEGVYRLPEAQLDRFLIRSRMGYLDEATERAYLQAKLTSPDAVSAVSNSKLILEAQRRVGDVHADPAIIDYVHGIGLATRRDSRIVLGASPRALGQLLHAARAHALLEGRDFLIPDDVKAITIPVLNHRLILNPDAEMAGATPESILHDLLATIPVPKTEDAAAVPA